MRLVVNSYDDTIRNMVNECRSNRKGLLYSPYITMDNLEYALNTEDKERVLSTLFHVEDNYKTFHKNDDINVVGDVSHIFLLYAYSTKSLW